MKTITAREAKTRFGELLDTMQREPVVVTKNNRPVGILISIEDASNTLIPELFMQQEEGYDAWFKQKVSVTMARVQSGESKLTPHDEVISKVLAKFQNKASTPRF